MIFLNYTVIPLEKKNNVLEIACGTGEHAAYFCSNIAGLTYLPTEPQTEMHDSITAWAANSEEDISSVNSILLAPIQVDVTSYDTEVISEIFPPCTIDVIICINMIHISPLSCTESLFKLAAEYLSPGGILVLYGPFKENNYLCPSNVQFDESLKSRCVDWGIRDLEKVMSVGESVSIRFERKYEMPANNLCCLFRNA